MKREAQCPGRSSSGLDLADALVNVTQSGPTKKLRRVVNENEKDDRIYW